MRSYFFDSSVGSAMNAFVSSESFVSAVTSSKDNRAQRVGAVARGAMYTREPVTVRLDPQIVEFFRAGGRGWQTRMNDALAEYVSKRRRARP
jgi:uncharacterized protein (DUF4415 family)